MLPWIALAAGYLQQRKAKEQARKDLIQNIHMSRAQELGADTSPIRAQQARQAIDDQPDINPGLLMSAIGSTAKTESVDDRLAKEMAKRGLMRGYEPF